MSHCYREFGLGRISVFLSKNRCGSSFSKTIRSRRATNDILTERRTLSCSQRSDEPQLKKAVRLRWRQWLYGLYLFFVGVWSSCSCEVIKLPRRKGSSFAGRHAGRCKLCMKPMREVGGRHQKLSNLRVVNLHHPVRMRKSGMFRRIFHDVKSRSWLCHTCFKCTRLRIRTNAPFHSMTKAGSLAERLERGQSH
jgi:hypothetical protein